ncbi:MAG: response regulator [bacterium]
MNETAQAIRLLLVDDEEEFRLATVKTLQRRGFQVTEAADGEAALEILERERPDVVILDLKMPGMDGIRTLHRLRLLHQDLPVIILSGHGTWEDALAGIRLEITEFLQKPVDIDDLALLLNRLVTGGRCTPLRERTIRDLMVSPDQYPRLMISQTIEEAVALLKQSCLQDGEFVDHNLQIQSMIVYDAVDTFRGIIQFRDILKLVIPPFLEDSPYTTYFTGMFLSQCKVLGKRSVQEILDTLVTIDVDAPLMEAVDRLVRYRLESLPVMDGGRLVGVLRERDVIFEIVDGLGRP